MSSSSPAGDSTAGGCALAVKRTAPPREDYRVASWQTPVDKTIAAEAWAMPPNPGDPAPDVSAPNQHGEVVVPPFEDVTVVFFYVEDGTAGCATQATQFEREADAYEDAGVEVYGVSMDDVDDHWDFAAEHGLEFDLLADPDGELCDAFDVERDDRGRPRRTTFVVEDGEVIRTLEGVSPDGHARDLLIGLFDDGVVDLSF